MTLESYKKLLDIHDSIRSDAKYVQVRALVRGAGWIEGSVSVDEDGVVVIDRGSNDGPIISDLSSIDAMQIM